jgi:hypothetical protein
LPASRSPAANTGLASILKKPTIMAQRNRIPGPLNLNIVSSH